MIDLGAHARDILTGFHGIVVGRLERLFGGLEIQIQPQELGDDGKPRDAIWFEASRVEVATSETAPRYSRVPSTPSQT